MIKLRDKSSGAVVGTISEKQLQFLVDQLVEESATDQDYYMDGPTLELLEAEGADDQLLGILRKALGDKSEVELEWERSDA